MSQKIELLSGAELARRLKCSRKRVYYLSKRDKLGYQSIIKKNGRMVYVWDGEHRQVASVKKRIDFSDLEKDINYLILSAQDLRRRLIKLSQQFAEEEKRLLESRLKI